MEAKDKTIKKRIKKRKIHKKVTLKNIIIFLAFIISLLCIIIFYNFYFTRNDVYAKETISNVETIKMSEAKRTDIETKIIQNINSNQREEYSIQEEELEYLTQYKNNSTLPKGTIQVLQEGREGKQEITIKRVYEDEILVSEEPIKTKIIKSAINKVVEIGTANYRDNYKVKKGDTLYVTSDRLPVRYEPSEQSQKVTTVFKGNELKVLEIHGDWYKISYADMTGYVKSENTTYLNNTNNQTTTTDFSNSSKTKTQLIGKLTFEMNLNNPSGLTLEQFKKVLADSKDKNKIFENNAQYFYYIEQQYNINGIFIAAVGIHESAWGTSKIANNKNNLFGYGAYDSNPYNKAYSFSSYAESIDLIARVFVKYYLNPKGTNIYGGEKAIGSYYNGATLSGVNKKYASDKNWANSVYQHMKYLYNKL